MINEGWEVYSVSFDGSVLVDHIHIVPVGDIKSHDYSDAYSCWCKPKLHYERGIPIFTHNAADKRQDYETIN